MTPQQSLTDVTLDEQAAMRPRCADCGQPGGVVRLGHEPDAPPLCGACAALQLAPLRRVVAVAATLIGLVALLPLALPERLPRFVSHEESAAPPAGAVILGTVDGIEFVKCGETIWQRAWAQWVVFCTAHEWPYTGFGRVINEGQAQ